MRYKEIEKNKEINAYLTKGNANLGQLGFSLTSLIVFHCSLDFLLIFFIVSEKKLDFLPFQKILCR